MLKMYSKVKVKKNGFTGCIVEFDDNHGQDLPIYLVEYDEQFYEDSKDALGWFEDDEIEPIQ